MTNTTTSQAIQSNASSTLDDLRSRLAGEVIAAGHPEFDETRRMALLQYDHHPFAIVRAAVHNDVVETVRFARSRGLPLSVRSGGHSVGGYSVVDDAVVIDLGGLRAVSIDPEARTARVQAGARTRDVMVPAHAYGLALTTGDTASVGLGGLVTGGGIGWMVRKYGLTIDNLLSARMVTAAGDVVTASPAENPDLFWAVRGGGGNFGIVTEFEFKLAPVGQVLGGVLMLPATRDVVRRFLDHAYSAPEDLTAITPLMHAPPAPFVPEDRVGELVLAIHVVWTGDIEEGERVLAPLRALAEPVADTIAPIPYPVIYEYTAEAENPTPANVRSMFSREVSDESIDAILEAMRGAPGPFVMVDFRVLGGAFARVGPQETAFAHRSARYMTSILDLWEPGDDASAHLAWTEALWSKIRHERNGVYVNFLAREGDERVREAYPPETLRRLAEIKAKYDPDNFFRFNQNIQPLS